MAEVYPLYPRWGPPAEPESDLGSPWVTFDPSSVLERPAPPEWFWDGLILRGTVTLLTGEQKIGKSLFLQQLFTSAALNQPCLGREVMPYKSYAYFCEDANDWLVRRQFDLLDHFALLPPDLEGRFVWCCKANDECVLYSVRRSGKLEPTDDWRKLWQAVKDTDSHAVGIDTARCVFGSNENDPQHVTRFMRALSAQALACNASVILNMHPPADPKSTKRYAGAGAWLASARSGLTILRSPDYDEATDTPRDDRVLRGFGANYTPGRPSISFQWRHGAFVAVNEAPVNRPATLINTMDLDYRLADGLRKAIFNGAIIPAHELTRGSMPDLAYKTARITKDPILLGVPLNALYEAQRRMLERGMLVRVKVKGRCAVRPSDRCKYDGEEPWTTS